MPERETLSEFLERTSAMRPVDPLTTDEGVAEFCDAILRPAEGDGPVEYRAIPPA